MRPPQAVLAVVVVAVAGVAAVGDGLRGCRAVAAEGVVARGRASEGGSGAAFAQHRRAAEMVGVDVEDAVVGACGVAADAHGDRLASQGVGAALDAPPRAAPLHIVGRACRRRRRWA